MKQSQHCNRNAQAFSNAEQSILLSNHITNRCPKMFVNKLSRILSRDWLSFYGFDAYREWQRIYDPLRLGGGISNVCVKHIHVRSYGLVAECRLEIHITAKMYTLSWWFEVVL